MDEETAIIILSGMKKQSVTADFEIRVRRKRRRGKCYYSRVYKLSKIPEISFTGKEMNGQERLNFLKSWIKKS